LRLFEGAGAKYFVLTSKHHDGMPIFNSKVSGRNTVALGPHKDFVGELFAAAKASSPLRRGLYYSISEWYNLLYPRIPHNPFTGAVVPYTGCPTTGSYSDNFMHPQMKELIDQYEPDILWGDGNFLGPGPDIASARAAARSVTTAFYHNDATIQYYIAQAAAQGREVAYNDRFLIQVEGFPTTEESVPATLQTRPFETCMRLGPTSWAFNTQDSDSSYMSVQQCVNLLVDIVSKNGNFLLNIGPGMDGSIAAAQQQRLLGIGAWLAINGRAIYGTKPWIRFGDNNLRYTRTASEFNVISLGWPGSSVTLDGAIPVNSSWKAYLLGTRDVPLTWVRSGNNIVVTMPAAGPSSTDSTIAYTIAFR
jgi:alpha-L-fucosidase